MHPSYVRLLNCARAATVDSRTPVRDSKDLGAVMKATSQNLYAWKRRGVSKQGAMLAQQIFGCTFSYILDGAEPQWIPNAPSAQLRVENLVSEPLPTYSKAAPKAGPKLGGLLPTDTFFACAPVVLWANMEAALTQPNDVFSADIHISAWARGTGASAFTKFTRAIQSKVPSISDGDLVAIDPKVEPHDGAAVLIKASSGWICIYRYRALASTGWEAIAPNEHPLESERHGLTLLGVVISVTKWSI